jgi:hypothetical protein
VQDFSPARYSRPEGLHYALLVWRTFSEQSKKYTGEDDERQICQFKQLSVIGVGLILTRVDKNYPAYGIQ